MARLAVTSASLYGSKVCGLSDCKLKAMAARTVAATMKKPRTASTGAWLRAHGIGDAHPAVAHHKKVLSAYADAVRQRQLPPWAFRAALARQ
eukprot:2949049-Amphidinium_carterae.1